MHWIGEHYGIARWGFSKCLIRSALIRQSSNKNMYLSAWKSMTIWFYIHLITKRAESIVLLDLGAMENFMSLAYTNWLWLPIKQLPQLRPVLNVNSTENKSGKLKYYMDLNVWTGKNMTMLWFFLSDLGEHKVILGYPWFTATQLRINWKKEWIDHSQLPIVLRAPNAQKATFIPRIRNVLWPIWREIYFLCRVTVHPDQPEDADLTKVPKEFHHHAKVFSEQHSQQLPKRTVWDHAIELLPNALKSLVGSLLRLPQDEIKEIEKFIAEHLQRGAIRAGKGLYTASFFFVKKADGKIQLVQDYQPLNKYTKKNQNISPLIPQVIDQLVGCTSFMKFNIRWGYNNIRIKEGNEWKAVFLMPQGLFKPLMMFFGLTNSLTMF